MGSEFEAKIEAFIKNMPSLPASVTKVVELCNNPQASPADLNHVISLDPVLVGRVLKLVNSAYYNLGTPVTNLVRAIIMLGMNTVKNLALSSAVLGGLSARKDSSGLNMDGFWQHSLCVGVSAKIIARKRGVDVKLLEEYFTAGLLHDIGKIPLNAALSREYMLTICAADRERIPLYRAEEAALGTNHCIAGAMIVKAWQLGGPVGDAIMYHHNYGEYAGPHRDAVYSIAVANWFASAMEIGFSGDLFPDKIGSDLWEVLETDFEIFNGIDAEVNAEIEKAKIFLKL